MVLVRSSVSSLVGAGAARDERADTAGLLDTQPLTDQRYAVGGGRVKPAPVVAETEAKR